MTITLDAHIPAGPIDEKWTRHKFDLKLVNPSNRRKFDVIVVGAGHAGCEAALASAEDALLAWSFAVARNAVIASLKARSCNWPCRAGVRAPSACC